MWKGKPMAAKFQLRPGQGNLLTSEKKSEKKQQKKAPASSAKTPKGKSAA